MGITVNSCIILQPFDSLWRWLLQRRSGCAWRPSTLRRWYSCVLGWRPARRRYALCEPARAGRTVRTQGTRPPPRYLSASPWYSLRDPRTSPPRHQTTAGPRPQVSAANIQHCNETVSRNWSDGTTASDTKVGSWRFTWCHQVFITITSPLTFNCK